MAETDSFFARLTNSACSNASALVRCSSNVSLVTEAVTNGWPSLSPPTQLPKFIIGNKSGFLILVGFRPNAIHELFK